METNDPDELVEAIVLIARSMNKHSAPHLFTVGDWQVMVTSQEEHGNGLSWWVRLLTNTMQPIQSWHAEGNFGLMNAATQLSLRVYPYKRRGL